MEQTLEQLLQQPQQHDLSEERLAQLYLSQAAQRPTPQPLSPSLILRFWAMGLASAALLGAMFLGWLYRPVDQLAQAEALRTMSRAVIETNAQAVNAIAEAKPDNYKCMSLIAFPGSCEFPEQRQQQQPPTVLAKVPSQAAPAVDPAAVATLKSWDDQGYDSMMVETFIQTLYQSPDPQLPPADALAAAYRVMYFDAA